jgi:hypothetical protein
MYRRANWAASLWLVLGFPAIVGLSVALKLAFGSFSNTWFLLLVVVWLVVWAGLCLRVTRFRCPRCQALYFSNPRLFYGAGSHCGQCGLPLYASEFTVVGTSSAGMEGSYK